MPYVYAIGKTEELIPPYKNCYIGVTDDLDRRWDYHVRSEYTVGKYIRKHNLKRENMISIFETDKDECFEIEKMLRYKPSMGLNEATGGKGGYTSYTKERNEKISKAHKGKTLGENHKKKISIAKKGKSAGKKNNRAKKWILTSPSGVVYNIHGNLHEVCESLNLLTATLRYYVNSAVPEVASVKIGGFREKNEKSKDLRMNTTGWSLFEESNDSGGV